MLRKIRLLRAGRCLVDRSALTTGDPAGTMLSVPIWVYLLCTDDALFLVDSGMPTTCVDNPRYFDGTEDAGLIVPEMREDDAIERILQRQGIALRDIDGLISTHWHFDHAGGNRLFREQTVFVHSAELEAARHGGYVPECTDMTLSYRLVEDGYEPTAGVTLLHTPGHTPGHLSVYLRPQDGPPIILTIDAVYTRRNWDTGIPGAMWDPEIGRRSVQRLMDLARTDAAHVFFGHDAAQADELFWRALAV